MNYKGQFFKVPIYWNKGSGSLLDNYSQNEPTDGQILSWLFDENYD